MDFIEKNVKGDGNCFFRVLSYYYRNDEKFYNEFRQLIHELFVENLEKFIDFFPDSAIFKEKLPENKEESLKLLKKYADEMIKDKTYAWDIEVATTAHYLGVNINLLINSDY